MKLIIIIIFTAFFSTTLFAECPENNFENFRFSILPPSFYSLESAVFSEEDAWDDGLLEFGHIFDNQDELRSSGMRATFCASNPSEEELEDLRRDDDLRQSRRAERNIGRTIAEGFLSGTLEPTIGGTVTGNPTLIVGYNHPSGESTLNRVRGFLNSSTGGGGSNIDYELLLSFSLQNNLKSRMRTTFGELGSVRVENIGGRAVVTRVNFGHATFVKAPGQSNFSYTNDSGERFQIYCSF